MAVQIGTQIGVGVDDVFRVTNLSDAERFKLSFECGEFFGAGDIRVKFLENENRVLIEGRRVETTGNVQVTRSIAYEHELPDGIDMAKFKAGWDPNEDVLIIEAPLIAGGQND